VKGMNPQLLMSENDDKMFNELKEELKEDTKK
jgi:hypothetical protein